MRTLIERTHERLHLWPAPAPASKAASSTASTQADALACAWRCDRLAHKRWRLRVSGEQVDVVGRRSVGEVLQEMQFGLLIGSEASLTLRAKSKPTMAAFCVSALPRVMSANYWARVSTPPSPLETGAFRMAPTCVESPVRSSSGRTDCYPGKTSDHPAPAVALTPEGRVGMSAPLRFRRPAVRRAGATVREQTHRWPTTPAPRRPSARSPAAPK